MEGSLLLPVSDGLGIEQISADRNGRSSSRLASPLLLLVVHSVPLLQSLFTAITCGLWPTFLKSASSSS